MLFRSALSLLINWGFKKAYLLGGDLGYIDSQYHHSKKSNYYDPITGQDRKRYEAVDEDVLIRKGNFRETVLTDYPFDAARINLEKLLKKNLDFVFPVCFSSIGSAGHG